MHKLRQGENVAAEECCMISIKNIKNLGLCGEYNYYIPVEYSVIPWSAW